MTFVFPMLLGGLLLAGIPVLVHLIMRQKPILLRFPAFRFLKQNQKINQRKIKLRQLLLLALRMALIVAFCLALSRPKLASEGLALVSEKPIAAILIFDTSPSMDYRTSDGVSRLDEARKRGLELIDGLPASSRLMVLDCADSSLKARDSWLSLAQAKERVARLKVSPEGRSLKDSLEQAYRLFKNLAETPDGDKSNLLPRFYCVFSDRARACLPAAEMEQMIDLRDQMPALPQGLQETRGAVAPLLDLLKELRQKLPPSPGRDYPEQLLVEDLQKLRERIAGLSLADLPLRPPVTGEVESTRRRLGTLLMALPEADTASAEYRGKLVAAIQNVERSLSGALGLFLDVGARDPVDVAILELNLPRDDVGREQQVFHAGDKFMLKAVVKATGREAASSLECRIDGNTLMSSFEVKGGATTTVPFEIDLERLKLDAGSHQVEVRLSTGDQLSFNNQRYLTFAVEGRRRVLVLADDVKATNLFTSALQAAGFAPDLKPHKDWDKLDLASYRAIYLSSLAAPEPELWEALKKFVQGGGGLGVLPGDQSMKLPNYDEGAAAALMPGKFRTIANKPEPGVFWNFDDESIYQHPILRPFRAWHGDPHVDIFAYPVGAFFYWEVEPALDANVLIRYLDDARRPALLEKLKDIERGRVVMFTTPFDRRQPRWNNYTESISSFYLAAVLYATEYLAGSETTANVNFTVGVAAPQIVLPQAPVFTSLILKGPDLLERLPALQISGTLAPGNYRVDGVAADGKQVNVTAFSVNVAAEESDLAPVPPEALTRLLGPDALINVGQNANLRQALKGQWSEPIELGPFLLIVLLLALAAENYLSNRFYRREVTKASV